MATDELLLRDSPIPVLRLYRWARPEVTFGYPQRWTDVEPLTRGRPATRRWTGGGFVEHGDDLTLALTIPATEDLATLRPTESYRHIHTAIRDALLPAHPTIRLATAADATAGLACFNAPACLDVLLGDRKIVGGAQRRTRAGLLYQGSLQGLVPPADFAENLARALATNVTPFDPSQTPDATDLAATRYANPAWTLTRRA
jgi:lipoate-protein ligase A